MYPGNLISPFRDYERKLLSSEQIKASLCQAKINEKIVVVLPVESHESNKIPTEILISGNSSVNRAIRRMIIKPTQSCQVDCGQSLD